MTVTPEATETQSLLERQPTEHRESPRSWSTPRKAAILGVVSFAVFNDAVGTGIVNPGASQIVREFQITNPAVIPFLISVHVIGMAIGPLIVSPASELWGRCPLMHISNFLLMASLAMGALSTNITTLLVARVITGMAGCIPIVLEGGFIADLVAAEKRGKIIAIWALAPVSGSAIGPIVAGELTLRLGWRSAFWAMSIVAAVQALVAMFILRETSDPSVLRKSTKSEDSGSNRWGAFVTAFARPVKLATLSPVVILSALKMSMAYVIFYILMSDLPILFGDKYDFDSSQIGYCYISPTIGAVFGFTILGGLADRVFQKRTVKRGMSKPQDRLAIMSFEVLLIAIGILAYGWSAQAQMHWIIPLLGANLTMVGSSGVVVSLQQYLTDYFGPHVPGAIAVCTVLRSVLGSVLPSTIPALFDRLGYGWGSSVLAASVLLFCPITSLLNRFEGYYENAQMY